MSANLLTLLPRAEAEGCYHVVIETRKSRRNKFAYDEKTSSASSRAFLPEGSSFPCDFGFVPATTGEDGDQLDVLVLMDAPAFSGCLIEARLIGALEAEQTEDEKTDRNDRLLAVAATSRQHQHLRELTNLPDRRVDKIEHFLKSCNKARGAKFKVGRAGAAEVEMLVTAAEKAFRKKYPTRK